MRWLTTCWHMMRASLHTLARIGCCISQPIIQTGRLKGYYLLQDRLTVLWAVASKTVIAKQQRVLGQLVLSEKQASVKDDRALPVLLKVRTLELQPLRMVVQKLHCIIVAGFVNAQLHVEAKAAWILVHSRDLADRYEPILPDSTYESTSLRPLHW
eukprot:GHRR01036356.1.p1 GENE.GHRR01036356.1~~GHRR01036356.1.p1  ORF type:complete len:156 (-),score=33.95 GHRR01036356.1:22-489(-)